MPPREDAFRWDGDDDPTLASSATAAPRAEGAPEGPRPAEAEDRVGSAPRPLGNAGLVGIGVLGGVTALFAIGWFLGGSRLQLVAQLFVDPVAYTAAWLLAVLAPIVWFATALVLTRERPVWLRFVALGAGVVVLVPWPFLLMGGAA